MNAQALQMDGIRRSLLSLAVVAIAGTASADLVTITATRDCTIYENIGGEQANGAGQYFIAGETYQTRARRGLISFDVSSALPAGCTVTAARLTLNSWQGTIGDFRTSIHRATAAWTTGASDPPGNEGIGAEPLAGDATWGLASGDGLGSGTAWTNAGGDFVSQASASINIAASGLYTWTSAALAADVQLFASDPSQNFGWFVIGDESVPGTARRFDSSESAELGGYAPTLEIEFSTVPAPGSIALLGIATILARRRTHR